MLVIPSEISLSIKFLTIDTNTELVIEKNDFKIDIQKIDKALFIEAYEAIEKIKEQIVENSKKVNQA